MAYVTDDYAAATALWARRCKPPAFRRTAMATAMVTMVGTIFFLRFWARIAITGTPRVNSATAWSNCLRPSWCVSLARAAKATDEMVSMAATGLLPATTVTGAYEHLTPEARW